MKINVPKTVPASPKKKPGCSPAQRSWMNRFCLQGLDRTKPGALPPNDARMGVRISRG